MSEDFYVVVIVALLPLTACMLVCQVNPYHALIIRGILGAVAALVYALFGAADVALTEALVGTMLSITLYAVAVRSSMSMSLGVLADESNAYPAKELVSALSKYHLRLEVLTYPHLQALQEALQAKEIHAISISVSGEEEQYFYQLQTRIPRLHEIMQTKLPQTSVSLVTTGEQSLEFAGKADLVEEKS